MRIIFALSSDPGLWREPASTDPPNSPVWPSPPLRPSFGRKQVEEPDGERLRGGGELEHVEPGIQHAAEHQQESFLSSQRTQGTTSKCYLVTFKNAVL